MITINVPQGGPEWLLVRAGLPTSSCFDKIITNAQMKPSASSEAYMYLLLAECVRGGPIETDSSGFMQRGTNLEDEAVDFFEALVDLETKQVGFCLTDDRKIGCSPDRLVGEDSGLEIKCPSAVNHIMLIDKRELPIKYRAQIQGSLYVTGRDHWHFMSYNPILPPLHIIVQRDEVFISKLEELLMKFLDKFDEAKKRLETLTGVSLEIDRAIKAA